MPPRQRYPALVSRRGALLPAIVVASAWMSACTARESNQPPVDASPCTTSFGVPNDKTGLDEATCRPTCGCGDATWTAPTWSSERIAELLAWTLLDPPPELAADPYPTPPAVAPGVCAVRVVDRVAKTYRLESFASRAEAEASGATMTHDDRCGLCSSLADLAVYASRPDLTEPVRSCGLEAGADLDKNVACLQALGFSRPCAQIWAYNTRYTRSQCLGVCLSLLTAPYHQEDGGLNACLLCDEQKSGPVFKAVAGRTRRNTGVPSSMCRPCSEVVRLEHRY